MSFRCTIQRSSRGIIVALVAVLAFGGFAQRLWAAKAERIDYQPSVDFKSFVAKKAISRAGKRERVIKILLDMLQRYPSGEEKAQLEVRLAELFLDKARHLYFLELHKDEPQADEILKGEIARVNDPRRLKKLRDSFSYNRAAIKIYRDVLKQYPRIKNRDEVMFYLAYNLQEIGKNGQAMRIYRDLIRRFPRSKRVPDANLVQGEYYFATRRWNRALGYYRKVLRARDTKLHNLALYKLSWCYFNLGSIGRAMTNLEAVITRTSVSRSDLDLKDEAIRDIVIMFSYGGYYKEAPFYFKRVGGDEGANMLKKLASYYYDQGKNRYAQFVYQRIIKSYPDDRDNPTHQKRLVDIAQRLGRKEDVIIQASKLVRFYSGGSKWSSRNRANWDALQNARDLSENTLRKIALGMHNEAQKTKDHKTYSLANASYKEYLDYFPNTAHSNKIRFFYAESLYKLGKLEQAGIEYSNVIKENKKSAYARQAAYGAIVSYDELIKKRGSVAAKGREKEAISLPLWEREMVRVSDQYLRLFPKDKRAPQIAFKASRIFYDHNQFNEAIKRFDRVVVKYPKSSGARFSANLVLDAWNIQEKWAQVVKWGRRYYKNKNLPAGKFKADILSLIEKSSFKVCKGFERSGRDLNAAKCYLSFATEFKQSGFADDAMNNAAVSYLQAKDVGASVSTFRKLIKAYPQSSHRKKAMLAIGKGYEDMARFALAAYYYEQFQSAYPGHNQASDLLYNAALFRENLGQFDRAISDYRRYKKRYPRAKDARLTGFSIAMVFEKAKNYPQAAIEYGRIASGNSGNTDMYVSANVKQGLMLLKTGKRGAADSAFRRAVTRYRSYKKRNLAIDTVELAAQAEFELVESAFRRYKRASVRMPLERFANDIKRKIKLLDSLIARYQTVVDYGASEWVALAVFRMAEAYQDLAQKLDGVKIPQSLAPEEQVAFRQQIDAISQDMRLKAAEGYRNCIDQAAAGDVFHEDVAKASTRLADLSADTTRQRPEAIHTPVHLRDAIGDGGIL